MDINWFSHIKDPAEQENFRQTVFRSQETLERLNEILSSLEKDLDRIEFNPKFYETPNWDYKQASNNGYRRCLAQVRQLINLDQKENNERPISIN
jgi:hypothetical protein